MDSACKKFLSRHPELQYITDIGKVWHSEDSIKLSSVRILLLSVQVQCSLSGHQMPCRVDVLKSYVSGKKFIKLKAHHDFGFSRLEPFLIPSKKRKYGDRSKI